MPKRKIVAFVVFIIILIFLLIEFVVAAPSTYTPLAPINGLTDIETGTGDGASGLGFASYLRTLYIWGVSAASGLAVVMIMWGGVGYMTSAGGSGVEEAKKRISAALLGLMLALSSYIILSTINKSLLNLQFAIGKLDVSVEGNAEVQYIIRVNQPIDRGGVYNGVEIDSDGYLVDSYGERIVDDDNNMIQANPSEAFYPHATSYSPQRNGDQIEGGYASAVPGLDGQSIVRTLDDVANGRSSYVTLAGDTGKYTGRNQIGNKYIIPSITYKDNNGTSHTLTNVLAYVHDTGSAFYNPNSKYWRGGDSGFDFDIAVTQDGGSAAANQLNTRNIQFIPVN